MEPIEIINLARRLSEVKPKEGNKRVIIVPKEDWDKLRDYLMWLKPVYGLPDPDAVVELPSNLVVFGIEVTWNQ